MAHDVLGIGDFVRAELVECTPGKEQVLTEKLEDTVMPPRFHKVCGGYVARAKTDDGYVLDVCMLCRQRVVDSEIA